jgi:hypothetical protein
MQPRVTARLAGSFEHNVAQREEVSDRDIHLSRLSGMAPADVDVLCDFTREEGLLLIVRCPKRPARYFHGHFDPKPLDVKQKSDRATGLVTLPDSGKVLVSDYDLMCVWRFLGAGNYEKIFFSAPDKTRPKILTQEAQALLDKVKPRLKSPFMHGAQDDFDSPKNPDVCLKSGGGHLIDRFMVFNIGQAMYVCNGAELRQLYNKLLGPKSWPYDSTGKYILEAARK